MPVLEGIFISAKQGKVTLISYNLEMGMKKEIYAKCDEEGEIVINARLLGDILRKMNGMQVEISADSKLNCNIKCGEASFDIMGMAANDYPQRAWNNIVSQDIIGEVFKSKLNENGIDTE